MDSFSFFLSGKIFICPSIILNDSFDGQSNFGCRSLLFITLDTSHQSLLVCKVSVEKSSDSLMGAPLQITAFKSLSLSLNFCLLIMMCLGVGLFGFILFGTLCTSQTCMFISFTGLGKFSINVFSYRFSVPCSRSRLLPAPP